MESIEKTVNLLAFFSFLILFKNEVQKASKEIFENSNPDTTLAERQYFFYLLFFWAVVASLLGGLFWNIFFNGTLGGSQEPHGWTVVVWSVTTNFPLLITLLILNNKYSLKIQKPIHGYFAFFIGTVIGSLVFYDWSLSGEIGFRNYFETQNLSYAIMEFWLVVIWSSLLTVPGFVLMEIVNLIFVPSSRKARVALNHLLKQSLLSVGLTASAVSLFLWAFADPARFESARGVIAGLFLRMTIFFGLFIGSYTEEIVKKIHASKRKKREANRAPRK